MPWESVPLRHAVTFTRRILKQGRRLRVFISDLPDYYHHLDGDIFYMAGLHNEKGCCIVTKEASEKFKDIHHRQPFLLTDEQISDWLSGEPFIKDRCSSSIIIDKVSSFVNTPKNNSPDCIEPI